MYYSLGNGKNIDSTLLKAKESKIFDNIKININIYHLIINQLNAIYKLSLSSFQSIPHNNLISETYKTPCIK